MLEKEAAIKLVDVVADGDIDEDSGDGKDEDRR